MDDNIKLDLRVVCFDTGREEQRLRLFDNKVFSKIFWANRGEITGKWRKLYNVELLALNYSSTIIRNFKSGRLRWAGHVARRELSRNIYKIYVGRPAGRRPLGG